MSTVLRLAAEPGVAVCLPLGAGIDLFAGAPPAHLAVESGVCDWEVVTETPPSARPQLPHAGPSHLSARAARSAADSLMHGARGEYAARRPREALRGFACAAAAHAVADAAAGRCVPTTTLFFGGEFDSFQARAFFFF
jgi:hypothetical protein